MSIMKRPGNLLSWSSIRKFSPLRGSMIQMAILLPQQSCLGSPVREIQMLADSWEKCRNCIKSRVLLGVNRIISYERSQPARQNKSSAAFPAQTELWKELKKEIELHNPEHVLSTFQSLSRSMLPYFKQFPSEIYTWYIQTLSRLEAYFRETGYIDPTLPREMQSPETHSMMFYSQTAQYFPSEIY